MGMSGVCPCCLSSVDVTALESNPEVWEDALALLISEIPESPCPWLAALRFVIHRAFVSKLGVFYYKVT